MGEERRRRNGATNFFRALLALIAVGTAVAMVLLWPSDRPEILSSGITGPTESAEIVEVTQGPCTPPQEGTCTTAEAMLDSGPDEGTTVTLLVGFGPLVPDLEAGDGVRLSKVEAPEGAQGQPSDPQYNLTDLERGAPMLWLALIFAAMVILFGRLRGALSLVGLAASLLVVVLFIVPAILGGRAPLTIAIVGSMAVMLLTISLAHGLGPKSLAAMLGTTVSLAVVALLALLFVDLTHLTGLAGDESALIQLGDTDISFRGLLLAGMVIGALGVLDDVTVSQASTVLALRSANPALRFAELYRRAIDVGRDHVSATVNTLVLAYIGTSLPVLLIFGSGGIGAVDAANVELVAQEIVATLVGSIGLIAAVPVTTALAAAMATRIAPEDLPADVGHAHVH
ncbi:MAG: YibE/F family protein [Actinomycetota bacterium]|nr:YibE/F family protein [Actinomycetota bacterium]